MDGNNFIVLVLGCWGFLHAGASIYLQRSAIHRDPFHPRLAYRLLVLLTLLYPLFFSDEVQRFGPNTQILIACVAISFLVILDLFDFPSQKSQARTTTVAWRTSSFTARLFAVGFVLGWLWRMYALNAGLLHGTFLPTQLEVSTLGNLIGTLNNLSLIAFLGWMAFRRGSSIGTVSALMLGAEIVWALVSGSKIAIFYVLAPALLVAFRRGWITFSAKRFVIGIALGILVLQLGFVFVTSYRMGVQILVAGGHELSGAAIAESISRTIPVALEAIGASDTATNQVAERLNWARYFGLLAERGDLRQTLWMGSSLAPVVTWWIPRFFWPSKPTVSIGAWYGETVLGWEYETRSEGAITIWGDGLMNFGLLGVLMFSVVWVALAYFIYRRISFLGPWGLLATATIYIRLLLGLEQNIAAPLVAFQVQMILIALLWSVDRAAKTLLTHKRHQCTLA